LPQATQESCLMNAKCWARLRGSGFGLVSATRRGIRGVAIGFNLALDVQNQTEVDFT